MYGVQGGGVRRVERDVGRHDEDGYRTGFGRGGRETGDRVVGPVEQENDVWHQPTAWQKKTGMEGRQRAIFRQRIETPLYID